MEAFVLKTLKRLRKDVPRRFKDLRSLCDEMIVLLSDNEKKGDKKDEDAGKYYEPLRLACETRQPRLMEIGLDGIHFLIEHGYLRGYYVENILTEVEENTSKVANKVLMESIIQTVSSCSDEYDEVVQLQVIKVLLTAVTSSHCEVHEGSLLLAVRSCFHIHLISRNPVNKTTAKAALTQILSVINQRMEVHDSQSQASIAQQTVKENNLNTEKELNNPEETNKFYSGDKISETLQVQEETKLHQDEIISDDSTKQESKGLIFPSIYHKDAYLTFRSICKISMKSLQDESGSHSDPIALQNKILSLELIQHILQHCGKAFQSDERIINVVREYLCVSLLSNCTSNITQVTGLSLQIFVSLLKGFKDHLKNEVEIFVTGIFLKILESENSSYEHKLRVLEVFHILCKDSAVLVEIFINYDCDLEAIDLFRRIVDGFAKIAKNPNVNQKSGIDFMSSTKKSILEESQVRFMGLEGLVIILNSLIVSGGFDSFKLLQDSLDHNDYNKSSKEPVLENENHEDDFESVSRTDVDNVTDVVGIFDKKQKFQEEIENGILKFNLSPKKGLAYLANLKHIEMTPKGVANFLLQYQERLDKSVVGDYLGREREYENGFCLKVLHEYVDSMDFKNLEFDLAIRQFLSGFRLPGEAQKIDRIMEKFAERYYLQNRDKFASADMAFILAFSTIMLQTNLHNPAIREDKRMTKEQFLRQNKGISSDGELPEDMLMAIYDRIAAEPIRINQDEKFIKKPKKDESSIFSVSFDKKRKDAYNYERIEMVKAGEALFKQKSKRGMTNVKKVKQADEKYVRPMFEVAWAPIFGVLSQVLETAEDDNTINLCLTGFQYAIRLACRLDFPVAKDTYINALTKFTTLDTVKEMHQKNVDCIKILLDIALFEKDYIDESWIQILQSISQLSRLQLFASGLHTDEMFFSETASVSSTSTDNINYSSHSRKKSLLLKYDKTNSNNSMSFGLDPFTKFFSGPTRAEIIRTLEEANADMVMKEISSSVIDQVFLNSQYLSEQSVWYFVKSLCEVSMLEINTSSSMNSYRGKDSSSNESTSPRIFSLQKIVEVADFNMNIRPRIAWSNIWNLLTNYFTTVGMNDNLALAMFAIDSLKQLSIKFLQKEELSNFNFQRIFLKPYEVIISKTKSLEIKDLILRCIDIMIRACASNIRSGWRTIFAILEVAACQEVVEISSIGFETLERLMTTQFDLLIFDFVELMNCLVAFVAGSDVNIALRSLNHLSRCADNLAQGKVSPAIYSQHLSTDSMGISWEKSSANVDVLDSNEASVFRLWWPLLLGLSTRVADSRIPVRVGALHTLDQVLRNYGNLFSSQTWAVIFKGVLFPMIDSAKTDFATQSVSTFPSENPVLSANRNSWIGTMGQPVLKFCRDMFFAFEVNSSNLQLFSELLCMFESCICQDTEILAKMGLKAFHDLVLSVSERKIQFSVSEADLISKRLCSCIINNVCTNFSDLGNLSIVAETPIFIKRFLRNCPLLLRRNSKEVKLIVNESELDTELIETYFGKGHIEKVMSAIEYLDIPIRNCIKLSWNARLFTVNDFKTSAVSEALDILPWDSIHRSVMTSFTVSLDTIKIVGDIVKEHYDLWTLNHFQNILNSLEVLYWHARSFNSDKKLRKELFKRNFMRFPDDPNRLPHLLEQEVFSLSKILEILFLVNKSLEYQAFAAPIMQRLVSMTCEKYLNLEAGLVYSNEVFDNDEHEAYGAAVLITLHGIIALTLQQYKKVHLWFADILAKLILCDDVDVRSCVSQIYLTHVNKLVVFD